MKRLYVISILLLHLVFFAWSPPTVAWHDTSNVFQRFTLQEFGAFSRSGELLVYTWPGSPFGFFDLGADFFVEQACSPGSFGGVFLSEGEGWGYLSNLSPWPFPFPTRVPTIGAFGEPSISPELCDENADLAVWFRYGESLDLIFPRTDGDHPSFFGEDQTISSASCETSPFSREGVFFVGLRRTERQLPDISCPGGLNGETPIRVGNTLICSIRSPWVSASGVVNPAPVIRACEWYATCSDQPVAGIGPGVSCATGVVPPPPPPPPPPSGGSGVVNVTVINASNRNSISGASVDFSGGPTQTTDGNGAATFNNVPAGAPIAFTASASSFATGTGTVTPVTNSATPLTIALAPVVACSTSQVAGGDTPDTRFVNLNNAEGTFLFSYNTYSQKDRIIVSNDGRVLFDTGCVGVTNESKSISYSGSSTGVTVEIQPNCGGGTGTAWDYFVNCPQ